MRKRVKLPNRYYGKSTSYGFVVKMGKRKQPEAIETKAICDYLRLRGCYVVRMVGSPFIRGGIPDILACCRGMFIAIEVKTKRGRVTEKQAMEIEAIREAGGRATVAYGFEEAKKFIDEILGEYSPNESIMRLTKRRKHAK